MERTHRPILPSSHKSSSKAVHLPQVVLKKRKSVRVACDNCRKAKCNAKRPQCDRCSSNSLSCYYMSTNDMETPRMALNAELGRLREALKEHVDIIEHIRSDPEPQALAILRRLRSTPNNSAVLASLKGNLSTINRPSDLSLSRNILPPSESGIEFELTALHHIVYPKILPIDVLSIDINKLATSAPRHLYTVERLDARTSEDLYYDIDSALCPLRGIDSRPVRSISGPVRGTNYCDRRLELLRISYWTTIPISNEFAASAISLYLETDHPILGFFDADLFLKDLIDHRLEFCSPFLVTSLLYLACQSYTAVDMRAHSLNLAFFVEAERNWAADRSIDSPCALAATMTFGYACILSGKEKLGQTLFAEAGQKAARMRLFGVADSLETREATQLWTIQRLHANAHAAFGAFCWLIIFGMHSPECSIPYPPALPIPGDVISAEAESTESQLPLFLLPKYMGHTFATFCRLCLLVQEIQAIYQVHGQIPSRDRIPLAFAESKYQRLLSWADTLSLEMARDEHSPAHVYVFYAMFHRTVLYIFQPFLQPNITASPTPALRSFTSFDSRPEKIYDASVKQLKNIVLVYVSQLQPQLYSSAYSATMLPLCSALLQSTNSRDNQFYFMLCIHYFKKLYRQFAVCAEVIKALLMMALQKGMVGKLEVYEMLEEMRQAGQHHDALEQAVTTTVIDFDLAITAKDDAQAHKLALQLDELALFDQFLTDPEAGS